MGRRKLILIKSDFIFRQEDVFFQRIYRLI